MFRDQPWNTFQPRWEPNLRDAGAEEASWTPGEVRDAVEWIRGCTDVHLDDRRWLRRTQLALQNLRDGLIQKDLELGSLSGWQRDTMAELIPRLRVRARSALVRIGVLLSGMTALDPSDVEHGLTRLGDDVSQFLDEEADVYLRLEAARRAELGPMVALAKIGV
jgi:hypothetical protein